MSVFIRAGKEKCVLIAVDTNVLIDQADGVTNVIGALSIIKKRLPKAVFVVTPTVLFELGWGEENEQGSVKKLFAKVNDCMLEWGYQPINLIPVGHGIVQQIAFKLRHAGIIPDEEENDAQIIAEAALLGCPVLLSSDGHLLDANNNEGFHALLKDSDVEGDRLVIGSPRTIVEKFFLSK